MRICKRLSSIFNSQGTKCTQNYRKEWISTLQSNQTGIGVYTAFSNLDLLVAKSGALWHLVCLQSSNSNKLVTRSRSLNGFDFFSCQGVPVNLPWLSHPALRMLYACVKMSQFTSQICIILYIGLYIHIICNKYIVGYYCPAHLWLYLISSQLLKIKMPDSRWCFIK